MKRILALLLLTVLGGLLLSSCHLTGDYDVPPRNCLTCGTRSAPLETAYLTIDAPTAKAMMEDASLGAVVVDVRTQEEYDDEHIAGALLIPSEDIDSEPPTQLNDYAKDQTLLIYCQSGNRSAAASEKLSDMGYTNVYDFGGIKNWPYETQAGATK